MIAKASINTVWSVTTGVMTVCILFQLKSILNFQTLARKEGLPVNGVEDLLIMVILLAMLAVFRKVFGNAVRAPIYNRLLQTDPEGLKVKYEKNVRAVTSCVWYCFVTVVGYMLFKNHENMPVSFLGKCGCDEMMEMWPYNKTGMAMKIFYMLMLAHHTFSLLELCVDALKRPDTAEMALHHIATVSLMLFSYYLNYVPAGLSVLMAHNVGDIMINVGKFTRDLKLVTSNIGQGIVWTLLFISWFVPRVVLISYCIIPAGYNHLWNKPDLTDPTTIFLKYFHFTPGLQTAQQHSCSW